MDLHNKAVSIQQSADLSSTNELENKFATHLSQFSEGSVIHLPRLEHALKTLPFKLDDKKTRKKLEEIIQELDDFTKVSIQSFVTYKSTVFLETNSYFSESVIPERSLVLIGDSSIIWTHNVFRFIKKLNHKYLEVDVLSNIEQYRTEENFYSPKKVRSLIFARLEDYETTRLLPYYNEIMEYSSNQKNFKDIDMKKMTRCLALTNQYIKGYVLYNIITMAIQKYISVFTDPEQTPYLELSVHYRDGSIEIQPSLEKIKQYHSSVLKKIASLCSSWEYLGKPLAEAKKKRLNIKHQDDFLVAQETIMLQNLDKLLSPLLQKFKIQEADLSEISKTFFEEKNSNVKTNSSSVDNKFWMTWQDKIEAMNDVDFIGIFRLFQQPLKTTLLALVKLQTTQALCDLIYKHLDLNLMIRKEANAVKDRCRKIPCCSEELVAVSKYMQTCSTQWIQGLKLRTIHLLKLTTELMNVVELTNDHTNLVCGTISLLNSIKASFREFKQMFDATKGEIEEDLRITTEELNRDLEEFGNNYLEAFNYFDKKNHLLEYVQYCSKYLRSIEKFDARVAWINKEESLLNIVLSTYPELDEIKMIVFPLTKLIIIVYKWLRTYSCYMDGPFEPATFEGIERVVDENSRLINGMNISFKAKIRQHILDNYPKRFKGFLDDPDFNAWPSPMKIAHFGLEALSHIKNQFVLIEMLANPHLRYRHWEELSSIVGFDLMPNKGSSLRQFISYKLEGYYDKIQIISTAASREAVLQQNFESMQLEWVDVNFETTYIKELFVLGSTDDIREILDRHMNDTVTMRGSAFVKPIKDPIDSWHEFLLRTNSILDKWCDVQEQWLSFLDIFSVPAIYAIMGQESVTFKCVDQDYRSLLDRIKDSPQVINVCEDVTTLPTLNNCLYRLEVIRVGVNAYIQNVRLRFPRMFFLPNRESLYILSQTSDPQNVEPYLTQCFEGIKHICLNERNEIESVINSEGEKLDFTTSVSTRNAQGIVEKWLIKVETVMFESIKHELKKNIPHVLSLHNDDWLLSVSGQVVMCINQILWTAEVQTALKKTMSRDLAISLNSHKERLNLLIESIKKLLPKQKRMTVSSLIIQELHNITVVESLIKNNCVSVEEFLWVGQLRYYWSANDVIVEMLYTTISYGYEYIGNISHLVETPLTDRCFRSILSAYHLHLHGALIGPSGVGKTETFKNLSKHLAIKCIVHSCSSGIGLSAIEMFLRGAAACGAWVCFKRLDSVENSIISVVNQHLLALGQAVMSGFGIFDMNGLALKLKSSCMISVTLMSGTSNLKLPKELKAMFRTIPLVVPEYSLIIEATLYSVGVSSCKPLATKLVTAMKMYEELLILKPHRLGLRTILSIVTIMDDLKQKNLHHCEMGLLCSAVKRIILPQLTNKDIIDFDSITKALFPYTELNFSYDERVAKIIKEAYIERNLLCDDKCLSEMMVLYETLMNNQGVIVIGPPFAGKTQFLQILNDVVLPHSRESSMEVIVINPNIISNNQLYGMLDERSSKWTDGLISRSIRSLSTSSATSTNLLVFDGPISESWADGLNTLLDDNKKLCLGSGEIISFHSNSLVVFEVDNIDLASPALVSRCGLVNFDLMKTAWKSLVRLWMDHIPVEWRDKGVGEKLELLLGWLLPPCLHFINKFCQKIVDDGPYHNVHNCLKMTEFQLTSAYSASIDSTPNGTWTSAALILGLLWGLGGALDCASKQKFDIFFKNLFTGALEEYPVPETYDPADMTLPMDSSLYDYGYLFRVKGGWKYLSDIVKTMKLDDDQDFSNMIIPTIETFKYLPIVKHCIKENIPVILCGPTSTGKTFYIHHVMSQDLSPENYSLTTLTLTGKMTSSYLQEIVLSRLIKQRKGVYSSPVGKKSVVFMDDLALPSLGGNHQPVHELIRQYCDYSYWFDADNLSKITMKNIYFFGTIGSGRGFDKSISPRLLRHFFLLAVSSFSDETISRIFSNSLLIGLRKNGFPVDIHTTVNAIVAATSFLYNSVMDNLRPTPSNCHYVYSLKDFSKILQGIMLARKESADNKRAFIRLWVHETLRVFGDRIHKTIDRCWLFECLGRTIEEVYKDNISNVLDNLGPEDEEVQCESLRNLVFTSGIVGDVPDERKYEEASIDDYHRFISKTLEEYNSNHETKLNIIVFRYVLEHVARLCRVFIMPGASIILIGIGGTGRQSFIKLATAVGGETLIKIEGSSHYGVQEWRSDIKKVMKMSGGQDRETVFVFNEFKTNEEFYYQDIDALLVSGEIPNLFVNDDLQDILEMARLAAQGGNRNLDINPSTVFQYFVSRSKKNLHLVICLSPIGKKFRRLMQMYPSLLGCCSVDWYEGWPKNAMECVGEAYLINIDCEENMKTSIINVATEIHFKANDLASVLQEDYGRTTYITSSIFLKFMELYKCTYLDKLVGLSTSRARYVNGLSKLASAENQVFSMQHDLAVLQPQLEAAMEEAKVMLENVEKERITVDKASYQVKEDEKVANIQAEAAIALKTECENDLALAIPILEDAIEALNTLKPTDITLVKSMKNPPDNVKLVMAAVCVMKDVKPDRVPDPTNPGRKIMDFWGPSKRILGDMAFLQTLKDYDKDNIPPHIMQMIRKVYIPNKDFRPHVVAKASSAAEGLCKWVLAMDKYDTVVKMVAPKKKKLATAEEEYGRTVGLLEEKRAELILLQSKLKDLNTTLSAAVSQKQKIEKEVDLCAQKLRKAETIIDSLSSEKERWTGQVTSLAQALQTIVGDILISTASVAYLGPFPKRLREWSILNWIELSKATEIPVSDCFDLTSVLVDKIERENWILSGLPEDNFSIESGVILQFSKRWPLCIDPQGQANKWIRALVTLKKGYISRASDENCLNYLQDAIENGFQFLIENVQDHSDLASDPLLDLLTHYIDISESFIINGKLVHFHPEFRLYMTTGIQNPNYLPQTYHNIALIDFTLGEKGLIEQLVTTVVEIERKEISLDHNTLLQKRASNRRELKEAEDAILELLSTESNIIGDHASVIKLKSCKAISKSAQEKEIESEKLQQEVDSARQLYIPLANFSSCLFAAISCLQNINPFYQYSMKWFLAKYVKSIKITKHDEIDLEKRICSLKRDLTLSVHKNIIVSVLNKHKLLVSFLVCTSLLRFEGNLTDDEWSLLCATVKRGHLSLSSIIQGYSGSEDEIYLLEELEPFKGLRQHFQENIDEWNEALMDITSPSIPSPFYERLTNFQKLILFKILRPDKAMSMVKKLVFDTFNTSLVEYQGLDLHDVYKDSSNSTPILFLMMPGSDPLPIIFDLSEKLGLSDRLKFLALGKNQESKIEAIIRDGQKDGHWVCIHNCNVVATHWLENISVLMQEYEPSANLNFRLFLTSSPDEKKLPFAMLKDCFKIALERTEALKRSLWECYTMGLVGSNKFYNCCGKRQNTFAKLLFGISFFHAVVKAREKFGSLGWNLPYNFDEQDYFITIKNLQYLIKTTGSIPLEAIHYLIGYCTYGGKVTNIWDQRILHTLSAKYINFDVLSTMGYCLCGSDEKYVMPIGYSQTDYITFINNLPELTNPEVLGFHPNSTLVHDIKGGADFFQAMSGFVLGDLKFQVADKKPEVEIIDSILNKVRPLHGLIMENEVEKDSLGLFHQKECRCYKALLEIIETTLSNLRKSCLGTNYITSDQEIVIEYLINNTVPTVWSNASYSSTKSLSAFIENLIDRITNLAEWINSRKKNQYQISAFFNPQAFFTAKMNEYSLQEQMDFHDVCLDHSVLSLPTSNEHFQINGLYLESCHWNSDRHMIEEGHGITRQEEVPSLNVRMVRKDEVNLHDKYLCPIYSTALRDRHCDSTSRYSESIAQIYLNCKKPQEQWILKGVKLLAEVDSP